MELLISSIFLLNTLNFEETSQNDKKYIEIENKLSYIIHELSTIINYNKELNQYFKYLIDGEIVYIEDGSVK